MRYCRMFHERVWNAARREGKGTEKKGDNWVGLGHMIIYSDQSLGNYRELIRS